MYFWFGWLTLGILWYIGALGRKPDQPAHEPRLVAAAVAVTAAAFLALGLFGSRPAAVLGVDGDSLQHSVANSFVFAASSGCERSGDSWTCFRWGGGDSSNVPYGVKVNRVGCWQAVKERRAGERGPPERASGCITLYDFLVP